MGCVDLRAWALLGWALLAGCGSQDAARKEAPVEASPSPAVPTSTHAGQLIARLQDSFRASAALPAHALDANDPSSRGMPLLPSGVATAFVRSPRRLVPVFGTTAQPGAPATAPPAAMGLNVEASDAFDLRDVASGLSVSVALRGANGAAVEMSDGYLVYPSAYESGADVLNRPYPSGTEQSLAFASRPGAEQIVYDVSLGAGVAGVRVLSNTVEFLDAGGAPRLRMAPPYVSGAEATSCWPNVTVQGCVADTNPAPPWNRAVVAPGSAHCAVTVDWSDAGIQYPALLDPSWSVGSAMAVARMHHGSARVTAGSKELALVFGGYAFTSTVASAELFDETTGTWAQTGSLVADVSYVPAVTLSSGTALALGGFRVTTAGGVEYDGVQAYSPASGTWTLQGHLGSAREEHTATLLASGNVLVAGGFGPYPQVFANALLYNPSTGTATTAGSMQSARGDHSATLLGSGKVLVLDGMGANAAALSAADLYDPTANTWSVAAAPPVAARFSHVAPLLTSGKVLLAGGEDLSVGIAQTLSTAIYDPTPNAWSAGPPTVSSHYLGTATVLTQGNNSGKVVLAGGDFALSGVELFDPTAVTWTPIAPLLTGRDSHVALSLQSGLLFAGGSDGNGNLLSSSELYAPDTAATAPQWPAQSSLTVTPSAPSTSAKLSWSAATDPNGVANYALYENGKLLTTVSGSTLTFTATGLTLGATTTFAVQALDPSSAPTWNGPTASYVATSTAIGPLVQHVSGSNLRNNSMASPFCYYSELPAPAQAGNAIVVGATWKGSATLSVTDDLGDSYAVEETFHDATDNQSVGIAASFGVAAGARKLSVCFSADPGGWVEPMATELAGVVGVDGAGSGASGSSSSAIAPALRPGGSDLLYQIVYTPGAPPSTFAAAGGYSLLSADIGDGWAGQYGPAAGSASPFALGSSQHWATAAILLRTGSAGSVPSGMRIVRLQHENLPTSPGAGGGPNAASFPNPTHLEMPTNGNLMVLDVAGGNGTASPPAATSISDGTNSWVQAQKATEGDCMSQVFYAANTVPSAGLPLTLTFQATDTDDTVLIYDVIGAASAPFDVAAGGGGMGDAIGNLTMPFTLTPAGAGELVFVSAAWDFNTGGDLLGKLWDGDITSGESMSGPFPVDENNGWGHAVSTSNTAMSFTWVPYYGSLSFGTYAGVAAAFRAGP